MYEMIEAHYTKNFKNLSKRYVRALGSVHASEDVVQEAYERALRYWESFQETEEFDNWFALVLKNAFKDYLKREKGEFVDLDSIPEEAIECSRTSERDLKIMLEGMHPDHKDILTMYIFKGFYPREIEMLTEYSAAKINKVIHRFRKQMEEELKM